MRQLIKYIVLAITIILSYLLFHGLGLDIHIRLIQLLILTFSSSLTIYYFFQYQQEALKRPELIQLIILLGFIMRIGYTLYTGCTTRPHDIGDLTPDGYGHGAYILKLLLYKQLPESNFIQFYHPPFFHLLGALVSGLVNKILGFNDYFSLVDAAKLVSCFASCAILLLCDALCEEVHLKYSSKVLVLLLLAFFPSFILVSGRVNQDALITFFMFCALLYTYRWYHTPSYKNTILLAFLFGFGMMTKTSMAVVALFTALIMCAVLFQSLLQHDFKNSRALILKLGCFGIISLPLGLWYPIRNYILFKQPLNYVLRIPENMRIFCGNKSFFQRFIKIDFTNLVATPFAYPWGDFNYPVYIMKSSVFGEFVLDVPLWISTILLFLNIILIICSLWAFYCLLQSKKLLMSSIAVGTISIWLLVLTSHIYFNIAYPYGCTMDFRYMLLTLITGALFMGLIYQEEPALSIKKNPIQLAVYNCYQQLLPWLILLFSIFSFMMFTVIRA